ncbi:MAG TPA: hypothetical protein VLY20_10800 [Nitrospiria bacterium]|nr:hypothetical protein [Nitrospiria bacterium]
MKTPRDQGLFFTVFFSIALAFILTAWLLLPVRVKIGEDEGGGEEPKPKQVFRGEKAVLEAEAELTKADEILTRLEKEKADEKNKDKKDTEKDKEKEPVRMKNDKNDKTPKKSDAKTTTNKK